MSFASLLAVKTLFINTPILYVHSFRFRFWSRVVTQQLNSLTAQLYRMLYELYKMAYVT